MSRVVVTRSVAGWTWWLQADLQAGCEVLVRGAAVHPDESACRGAATRFGRTKPGLVLSVQDNDGFWRLRFHDRAGERIAVSADRFADARTSRLALDRIHHAVFAAQGRSDREGEIVQLLS
jgi:hypothetical protein